MEYELKYLFLSFPLYHRSVNHKRTIFNHIWPSFTKKCTLHTFGIISIFTEIHKFHWSLIITIMFCEKSNYSLFSRQKLAFRGK